MATLPLDELVSVREYLSTSYSPDCEYVDGRIEKRILGEKEHSILQMYLGFLFMLNRDKWGVQVYPELRTQVARTRFRVPDVLVVRSDLRFEQILDQPPLIAIEILSPRDFLNAMQEKFDEYLAFGTDNIWVFDPAGRQAWTVDGHGIHLVVSGELIVPGTPIRVALDEVFRELDRV